MYGYALLKFKQNGRQFIVMQWNEDDVLKSLLKNIPESQRSQVENAWENMKKEFKKESVRLI